eukprot:CAMPEP_0180252334 /NCGR_PEP_ID=MMETSP0987-20121128/38942_1 /TAXON_ID=697907 /ORGANISM="non described non described, Strain CCMP2293" /LENGTH=124 /DNA_ID=CAMNT_0022220989 /DNA_START=36 /DNA_END=407 /DNA_ORIENTATION=-
MMETETSSVGEPLRGLRGLGLLNLHQVYEGYGQYLPAGASIARDPNAEQMLSTRGYTDSLAGTLRLAGAAPGEQMRDSGGMAGGLEFAAGSLDLAADDGTGGLVIQNPQVLHTLEVLFLSTSEA